MREIERKFLVQGEFPRTNGMRIVQGYLSRVPERTVRVRIADERGFITIKGASDAAGVSRFEWEREISASDARALLALAEPGIIAKTRWRVDFNNHIFEIDEFHGEPKGLILAEIELSSPDEPFTRPPWLGREVTGDTRYYNASLSYRRETSCEPDDDL